MSVLLVVEHDGSQIRRGVFSVVTVARDLASRFGGPVELLVMGGGLDQLSSAAARYGVVISASSPLLEAPTADRYARVIADVAGARKSEIIVGLSTTFAKDILPRATALLNGAMVGDVTGYSHTNGELLLRRPVFAGSAIETVRTNAKPLVITLRGSAFALAEPLGAPAEVLQWNVDAAALPGQIEYLGVESRPTSRPELTDARVVVSGGRPFRSGEEFEAYVGKLADALQGAAGCTRALVDAGIAPNEWQVGQTGKVVAPELYIALGISGAVQHLAGMKNSKVVVAVNSDPEAAIFSMATYGVVGDVRTFVPEFIRALAQ